MSRPWTKEVDDAETPIRQRLLQSAVELVGLIGYEGATVELIAQGAGTDSAVFHRWFSDKDECCKQAFEVVCDQFDRHLLPIYLRRTPWRDRIREAAHAAASFCREHEKEVRFGLQARCRYGNSGPAESCLRFHLDQVDRLRQEAPNPERVPDAAAELCVGPFLELVVHCHARDRLRDLPAFVSDLIYNAYSIYLGRQVAQEYLRHEEAIASLLPAAAGRSEQSRF